MTPSLALPDGRSLDLASGPLVMGIVNVTPDSFSDGGLFAETEAAVRHGLALAEDGAAILDIGGESTRPGHRIIDARMEAGRVVPVIAALAARSPAPISIDSWKAPVVRAALRAGATIVNDVWGAQRDPDIARVAAEAGAPIILMHNRETIDAGLDILDEVRRFLERSVAIAREAGIPEDRIVVDPGIGFGKTARQNLDLIRDLDRLTELGFPVLLGASRKSTLGAITGQAVAAERLAASLSAHLFGASRGAAIIRAHDVRAHVDALKVWAAIAGTKEF
jgi:dihydropteroate synthase